MATTMVAPAISPGNTARVSWLARSTGPLWRPNWNSTIRKWGRPPKRDIAVADHGKVWLGDTAVDITPGHTMGTISPIFDVRSISRKHRVLRWGGTAFNFGHKPERLQACVEATARAREVAKQQGVDVLISNHSSYDGSVEKLATVAAGGDNPFVLGASCRLP